ncbi:MAG: PQQ-binding-like beta-propeller repeat protein [Sandaracinus sp.]
MSTSLSLAAHLGRCIAAAELEGGHLAIVQAGAPRSGHRVVVIETSRWTEVASFEAPSDAQSGVTSIAVDGHVVVVGDDRRIVAHRATTGARIWERVFERVSLVDAGGGRVVVHVHDPREPQGSSLHVLRSADGSEEARVAAQLHVGIADAAVGADGTLVWGGASSVSAWPAGVRWPIPDALLGAAGPLVVGDDGACVVFATRRNRVGVMDLASGKAREVLAAASTVRSVGLVGGRPWVLDRDGRLVIAGGPTVDFGIETGGGFVSFDAGWIALLDADAECLRIRRLSDRAELFVTERGFEARAVGVEHGARLLVSSDRALVRIDADEGRVVRVGGVAEEILPMSGGDLALVGPSLRALLAGQAKPVSLLRSVERATTAGAFVFAWDEKVAEVRDPRHGAPSLHLALSELAPLRLFHGRPDGRAWIHLLDGRVLRAEALGAADACVARLPAEGSLFVDPSGGTIVRAHDSHLTRIDVEGFVERGALPHASEAPVASVSFSPSGRRLVAWHRDGVVAVHDLEHPSVVVAACAGPRLSAEPSALFAIDLALGMGAAFGPGEEIVALTIGGGITFVDTRTGELVGQLRVSSDARHVLVTDGRAFEWLDTNKPRAGRERPLCPELVARDDGVVLDEAAIRARRGEALLSRLLRRGDATRSQLL